MRAVGAGDIDPDAVPGGEEVAGGLKPQLNFVDFAGGHQLGVVVSAHKIPLLGVCLGHQAIGQAFGGKVVRAPVLMHGKMSDIHHHGKGVFRNLPSPIEATRYHSLIVERESLPECLEITAWTTDGIIMGMQHKELPIHGVQFHPESIASEHGHEILANFLQLADFNAMETA